MNKMLIYKGGQQVDTGTYWDLRKGRRIDADGEVVLPGDDATTYLRMPALVMLLLGPIIGILYVVLFSFIGVAVVLMFIARRVAEGIISQAVKILSFHWKPRDAYLTGRRKGKTKTKHDKM